MIVMWELVPSGLPNPLPECLGQIGTSPACIYPPDEGTDYYPRQYG